MQLNQCLQLMAVRNTASGASLPLLPSFNDAVTVSKEGPTTLLSETEQISPSPQYYTQGSVVSMLKCIVHEWGTNSRTNFYIPPEYYAGYSYLCDDCQSSRRRQWGWQSSYLSTQCDVRSNCHAHHSSAFVVHAEQLQSNLYPHHHSHHHDHYNSSWYNSGMIRSNNITMTTTLMQNKPMSMTNAAKQLRSTTIGMEDFDSLHSYDQPSQHSSPSSYASHTITIHFNMDSKTTVPYFHPSLVLPVPPLHLPFYYGALCWSFALAGMLMLRWPQTWMLHGKSGQYSAQHRRDHTRLTRSSKHWFPYRTFAWVLILWQSPCSFLADYVHMTNISAWHVIDRFTACTMMAFELIKLVTMRPYTRPAIYTLYLASCGIAMYCFLKGQESLQLLSEDGFVFWHSAWHCYPITASIVHSLEHGLNHLWGEYHTFGCEEEADEGKGGGSDKTNDNCYRNDASTVKEISNGISQGECKSIKAKKALNIDAHVTVSARNAAPFPLRRSQRVARLKT